MPEAILKRIEQAWYDTTRSHLISESIYEFDLDNQLLRVQDKDFLFVDPNRKEGLFLPEGNHIIKRIRPSATSIKQSLVHLEKDFTRENAVRGTSVKEGVRLKHELKGELVDIVMNVSSVHRFEPGERYRVDLLYTAPLGNLGPFLLFSGAIQPSDYNIARKLKVDSATKSVTLLVRRTAPFTSYIFEPDKWNYFPQPIISDYHVRDRCHRVKRDLDTTMKDFERARYFTIAANLS